MMIKPSTALRNEYNEISTYCKENGQPVFVKNGEGDLVGMSMDLYTHSEEQLDIREKLLEAAMQKINFDFKHRDLSRFYILRFYYVENCYDFCNILA